MDRIKQLFFGAKRDKLTDKAFMQSIATSVFCLLLCLVALCSVTWAWFNENLTSPANTIKAGNCNVVVEVMDGEDAIEPMEGTTDTYVLEAEQPYQIKITSTGSAKTSYCKLIIGEQTYYTDQISTSEPNNTLSFTLLFEEPTAVQIVTCWGTSSVSERTFFDEMCFINLNAVDPSAITIAEETTAEETTAEETTAEETTTEETTAEETAAEETTAEETTTEVTTVEETTTEVTE